MSCACLLFAFLLHEESRAVFFGALIIFGIIFSFVAFSICVSRDEYILDGFTESAQRAFNLIERGVWAGAALLFVGGLAGEFAVAVLGALMVSPCVVAGGWVGIVWLFTGEAPFSRHTE